MKSLACGCSRLFVLTICSSLLCCGPAKRNSYSVMLEAAEGIVKEPQNWQKNTSLVVDFQKAAAEAKNWSKVIKTVRSPKTGAYTFKEAIVHKDKIKEYLAS